MTFVTACNPVSNHHAKFCFVHAPILCLKSQEQYIVQQSNCVSDYAAGLAAAIAEKFPHADVYKSSARPETVQLSGS